MNPCQQDTGLNSIVIELQDADEIEAFYLETTGMKPGYIPLSSGASGLKTRITDLEGITLIWTQGKNRIRWLDQMVGDGLHLAFAIESEGEITNRGRPIDADEGQVWMPGREMDLIINGPYLSLDIGVDASLVEQLGWNVGGKAVQKVPQSHLDRLITTCRWVSQAPSGWSTAMLREHVLESLEPALSPWQVAHRSTGLEKAFKTGPYRIVRKGDAFMRDHDPGAAFYVDFLASSLSVSRRSVFHAYRKLLGMGPKHYFEIQRLQELRSRLKNAENHSVTVTSLASDLGFNDMGRLAARYRRFYGENPGETLRSCQ